MICSKRLGYLWGIVDGMESTTFALMARKAVQRSNRFMADNHEYVDKLADELLRAAVYPEKNFSMALNLVISYCRAKGISAKELVATVMTEADKSSDPSLRPKK